MWLVVALAHQEGWFYGFLINSGKIRFFDQMLKNLNWPLTFMISQSYLNCNPEYKSRLFLFSMLFLYPFARWEIWGGNQGGYVRWNKRINDLFRKSPTKIEKKVCLNGATKRLVKSEFRLDTGKCLKIRPQKHPQTRHFLEKATCKLITNEIRIFNFILKSGQ